MGCKPEEYRQIPSVNKLSAAVRVSVLDHLESLALVELYESQK